MVFMHNSNPASVRVQLENDETSQAPEKSAPVNVNTESVVSGPAFAIHIVRAGIVIAVIAAVGAAASIAVQVVNAVNAPGAPSGVSSPDNVNLPHQNVAKESEESAILSRP